MAAAAVVASLVADGPCDIDHIDSLGVSYPALLDDLETLKQ
jgi:5-enolpyruvylshikimate-3-phosphate synthase